MKRSGIAALSLSLLLLNACGWHLRGTEPLPAALKTLYLDVPANAQPAFVRTLRRSLQSNGVTLTETAEQAPYRLAILNIEHNRRTISTSDRGKSAEYELTTAVNFTIRNAEDEVITGPQRLMAQKVYLFDQDNVAGTVSEEELLRNEMLRDLAAQIIRQYRALEPEPGSAP